MKFKFQAVIAGEFEAPNQASAIALVSSGLSINLALSNTVKSVNIAAEPVSGIVAPGADMGFIPPRNH